MINKRLMYIWIDKNEENNECHIPLEYQICIMSGVVFNPNYDVVIYTNKPLYYDLLIDNKLVKNEIIPDKYLKDIEDIGIENLAHKSDYIRYNLLYDVGGIYSDTDIIFISSLDDLLDNGMVLSKEKPARAICCGVMLSESNHELIRKIIQGYKEDYRPDKWTYNSQKPLREMSKDYKNVKVLEYNEGFFYPNFEDIYNDELYQECESIESIDDIRKYFQCRSHHIWSQVSPGKKLRKYILECLNKESENTYIYNLVKYIRNEYDKKWRNSL